MSTPTSKPLAEQAAAKLREMRERSDRELREAIAETQRENSPEERVRRYDFGAAVGRARPRTTPVTTPEICADVLRKLCDSGRCWTEGRTLFYKGGTLRRNVPLTTPRDLHTVISVTLSQDATLDLCSTLLNLINQGELA